MKRALVTGAAGFVGANLVRRLLADGHRVHVLLNERARAWRLDGVLPDLAVHHADLRDAGAVAAAAAAARPDWVFHLAAHGAYSWQTDVPAILATNVLGTAHLVQACLRAGFEAFVNTGSSSEYGLKGHAPAETEWLEPNSCYAVGKAAATLLCRQAARAAGTALVTLRLYSVYGPYEEPKRLMPSLLVHGLAGRHPPLANPETARDYVYIDDAVEAYLLAASRPHPEPGAVYNVGTGRQTTLRGVVELSEALFPGRGAPAWGSMGDRQWDTAVWVADAGKIRAALGWEPRHDLRRGLWAFADWLSANPELLRRYAAELGAARAA